MDSLVAGQFFTTLINIGVIVFIARVKIRQNKEWMNPDVFVPSALGWLGLFSAGLNLNNSTSATGPITLIALVLIVFFITRLTKDVKRESYSPERLNKI